MNLTRFHAAWHGYLMRPPVRALWVMVWLLVVGGPSALAQTGTLGTPAGPSHDQPAHDQPAKPPVASPRVPVQKAGSPRAEKIPVVPAHGPAHPHKPVIAGTSPAKPPLVTPPVAATGPAGSPAGPNPQAAEKLPDPEKPEGVPSRLPRFASLRSDDINMRAGPGTRYRIDWVYKRRELPVEIEREFDVWRWVRDPEGIQGWVNQATLMGRRSFIVQKADATLRSDANDAASPVAVLKTGVIGRIRSCEASSEWCNVQAGSYRGYLRRAQFWGVLAGEAISP